MKINPCTETLNDFNLSEMNLDPYVFFKKREKNSKILENIILFKNFSHFTWFHVLLERLDLITLRWPLPLSVNKFWDP